MSKSNASAKNRRAFVDTAKLQNRLNPTTQSTPSIPTPQASQIPTAGLTIQQVIAILDKRLIAVESFVKDSQDSTEKAVRFEDEAGSSNNNVPDNLSDIISEFNSRFDILAEEVGNLKEIVLKLQTYTMDVNKALVDRHVPSLSYLGKNMEEIESPSNVELSIPSLDTVIDALTTEPENIENSETEITNDTTVITNDTNEVTNSLINTSQRKSRR